MILLDFQVNAENLDVEIEQLLNAEKHARLAGDVAATRNAATEILRLCFEARAWNTLNDQIVLLTKRRGQHRQVRALSLFFIRSKNLSSFCIVFYADHLCSLTLLGL